MNPTMEYEFILFFCAGANWDGFVSSLVSLWSEPLLVGAGQRAYNRVGVNLRFRFAIQLIQNRQVSMFFQTKALMAHKV